MIVFVLYVLLITSPHFETDNEIKRFSSFESCVNLAKSLTETMLMREKEPRYMFRCSQVIEPEKHDPPSDA